MAVFPSIPDPVKLSESTIGSIVTAEFDNNMIQQRATTTRKRKSFEATYKIDLTDFATLESFFSANLGTSFAWTHPISNIVYTVVFSSSSLDASYLKWDLVEVSLSIEEQ